MHENYRSCSCMSRIESCFKNLVVCDRRWQMFKKRWAGLPQHHGVLEHWRADLPEAKAMLQQQRCSACKLQLFASRFLLLLKYCLPITHTAVTWLPGFVIAFMSLFFFLKDCPSLTLNRISVFSLTIYWHIRLSHCMFSVVPPGLGGEAVGPPLASFGDPSICCSTLTPYLGKIWSTSFYLTH